MEGGRIYFVADVHLGLKTKDPDEREARFAGFLRGIPREGTSAVCLLGDIWDFWYEYRDVVPKYGIRVVSELIRLMDDGVEVWFCPGNHDIWTYHFFEELGIRKISQPYRVNIGGKELCLGHGDLLGGSKFGYRLMLGIFRNKVAQALFSTLHPWLAYRFGLSWSDSNRRSHKPYHFAGESEPLYKFALEESSARPVDFFVFGHFHDSVDLTLPTGARLIVLKDWMDGGCPCAVFENGGITVSF